MKTTKSKDGTTIAYDIFGGGSPLIYITGAICHRKFKPVESDAKVFAKEFSVYNYDRRGRGDSTNALPYSIEREVEDIEALIDAAGGKANLYGHSSGAVLALEAALRFPQKIGRVVLSDASYVHDESKRESYARSRENVVALIESGKNGKAITTFLTAIGMPKIFTFLIPLMPGWKKMKALAPTLEYDMILTSDLPPKERASTLSVPTLVLFGEKSPPELHSVAKQLATAISGAKLQQVDGQDHMMSAKVVLPIISSFYRF